MYLGQMLLAALALTLSAPAPVLQEPARPALAQPQEAPAAAEVAAAVAHAAKKNQRVLLVWGGEW